MYSSPAIGIFRPITKKMRVALIGTNIPGPRAPRTPNAGACAPGEPIRPSRVIQSVAPPAEAHDDEPDADMRRLRPLAIAALALAATAPAAAGAGDGRTVVLKDISFSPRSLTVSRGTTVTFAFRDAGTTHNVTSTAGGRFKPIGNRSSGSVRRTFRRAGAYRYACTLHPGMTGRITVR
jgi:plastocyanin